MTFVTLWCPALPTAVAGSPAGKPNVLLTPAERSVALQTLAEQMLTLTPHVIADQRDDGVLLWADARGLPAARSQLQWEPRTSPVLAAWCRRPGV